MASKTQYRDHGIGDACLFETWRQTRSLKETRLLKRIVLYGYITTFSHWVHN